MWTLLNKTRGQIGLTAYKDYIFGLLFYKYLSEKATQWLGEVLRGDTWENVYGQDPVRALDYMKRFNIPMISDTFGHFNQQIAFEAKDDFEGIFDGMRFDSSDLGSNAQARASVMISMIELLSAP